LRIQRSLFSMFLLWEGGIEVCDLVSAGNMEISL
jgi:hypothetical protein